MPVNDANGKTIFDPNNRVRANLDETFMNDVEAGALERLKKVGNAVQNTETTPISQMTADGENMTNEERSNILKNIIHTNPINGNNDDGQIEIPNFASKHETPDIYDIRNIRSGYIYERYFGEEKGKKNIFNLMVGGNKNWSKEAIDKQTIQSCFDICLSGLSSGALDHIVNNGNSDMKQTIGLVGFASLCSFIGGSKFSINGRVYSEYIDDQNAYSDLEKIEIYKIYKHEAMKNGIKRVITNVGIPYVLSTIANGVLPEKAKNNIVVKSTIGNVPLLATISSGIEKIISVNQTKKSFAPSNITANEKFIYNGRHVVKEIANAHTANVFTNITTSIAVAIRNYLDSKTSNNELSTEQNLPVTTVTLEVKPVVKTKVEPPKVENKPKAVKKTNPKSKKV